MTLIHTEIPEGQGDQYEEGWVSHYFLPMKRHFAPASDRPSLKKAALAAEDEGPMQVARAHASPSGSLAPMAHDKAAPLARKVAPPRVAKVVKKAAKKAVAQRVVRKTPKRPPARPAKKASKKAQAKVARQTRKSGKSGRR